MHKEFWIDVWEKKERIGFHQSDINPFLLEFVSQLNLNQESTEVFVPLCGKSRDLIWLSEKSKSVTGVELSSIPVEEFKKENPDTHNVEVLCQDFFDYKEKKFDFIYDRASMVAFPPTMREAYSKHLQSLLKESGKILLISFEFKNKEFEEGPPFSVPKKEIETFYQGYSIKLLKKQPKKEAAILVYLIERK